MTDYAAVDTERDAFLAAVARVFAQHRNVSERYALCDLRRLAGVVGGGFDEPVGVRRDEQGNIVTTFSKEFFNPIAAEIGDECVATALNLTSDPPSWECIMYLTA